MSARKSEDSASSDAPAIEPDPPAATQALEQVEREAASNSSDWSGDEHRLAVASAEEVGLDKGEVELELYTEAFKSAMVLKDPTDNAIVFRGRTVLARDQLAKSLRSVFDFVKIPRSQVALAVHDGRFEIRVPAALAERAPAAMEHAKVALQVWVAAGIFGTMMMQLHQAAASIVWGIGLLGGGLLLRKGVVSGRAMLAARLSVALAMFAQEEQLILPLRSAPDSAEG